MRRILLAFVLLGPVVGLGLLTGPRVPAAQEATPSGEAAPVILETLGSAPAADAPGMLLVWLGSRWRPGPWCPPTSTRANSS